MSDYRVIVTGSRDWADGLAVTYCLRREFNRAQLEDRKLTVVHGNCPTGADAVADKWASQSCLKGLVTVERFPADWDTFGKAAGPLRNQQMVDSGADLVLAFPLGKSRGTRHCMRVAREAGIPVNDWTTDE